ncbi:uncharacterized protein LOC144743446 [Ciona intestinalis]
MRIVFLIIVVLSVSCQGCTVLRCWGTDTSKDLDCCLGEFNDTLLTCTTIGIWDSDKIHLPSISPSTCFYTTNCITAWFDHSQGYFVVKLQPQNGTSVPVTDNYSLHFRGSQKCKFCNI